MPRRRVSTAPQRLAGRAGFSVLEAIIVLAITSLALVLVFSIGARATQTGFRLGRRALGVADAQIDVDGLRAVLDGIIVPPPHGQGLTWPDLDGGPDRLVGGASFPRATRCGATGPQGRVTLSIERTGGEWLLSCATSVGDGRGAPLVLADLGPARAAFTYSLDGSAWSDTLHVQGTPTTADPSLAFVDERRLWVRLASDGGAFDVVELLSSGLPPPPPASGAQ